MSSVVSSARHASKTGGSPFDNLPAELYEVSCTPPKIRAPRQKFKLASGAQLPKRRGVPVLIETDTLKIFEHIKWTAWEVWKHRTTRPNRNNVHTFDHIINIHRRPLDHGICFWPRPGDLQIRLVSRAFNRAMLRVYFKYEGLNFLAGKENILERFEEHIIRDDNKTWNIASAVEKLTVDLRARGYVEGSIFKREHAEEWEWEKEDHKNEKLEERAERLKALVDQGILVQAVRKMPKLSSLIVHLPEQWRSDRPNWESSGYDEDDDEGQLVNRCRNLESLGLVGTQRINLEELNWRPANGGLKNLYLSRVVGSAEKFLTLLSSMGGEEGGVCSIEAFEIKNGDLMDGTWESVFAYLLTSPSLLHFFVYHLVYNKYGKSSHLRRYNHRPWENVSEIWTESDGDVKSLVDVIRAVQGCGYSLNETMNEFADEEDEDQKDLVESGDDFMAVDPPLWTEYISST
ncbi:hypothetical protein BU23DRAFT_572725 [Bimuria novae-zelandiae CBS 107.79]|uniref:Uncharacterized protein n=1 Tax=Bimuria novae-zelandiae CBS 107.79 TaxID=1447943 RepID=A0A6A5UTL1_9PLEO|nr:hypothetical protein BU23DRAFT_572725 [Bimuria novae-zelandiae CBS 107.79]